MTINLNDIRFINSGFIIENVYLIDLHLYDSSLFANSLLIFDSNSLIILDTGTSITSGNLLNIIKFYEIYPKKVIIIPTHYHFDHTGGISILKSYFEKITPNIEFMILGTPLLIEKLMNPIEFINKAKKNFGNFIGEFYSLDSSLFHEIKINNFEKKNIYYENNWKIEALSTPGHSDDHLSIILSNENGIKICFAGEALGINLNKSINPVPASSAPDYNSQKYIQSINNLSKLSFDYLIFSHFGGFLGNGICNEICKKGLKNLSIFTSLIEYFYQKNNHTEFIVDNIYNLFKEEVATFSLNKELAKSLTFTIVYGILKDLKLK